MTAISCPNAGSPVVAPSDTTSPKMGAVTASQIWTILPLTGKSTKSALWPPSLLQCTTTSHSGARWDHTTLHGRPQDQQTEFALIRESLDVSRINRIFRVHDTRFSRRRRRPKPSMKLDKGHWNGYLQGLLKIVRRKPRSVQASRGLGVKRQLMLLAQRKGPSLIAVRPRIRDMIRDAPIAGLLSEQPLVARLDDLVETGSAAFLDALDNSEKLPAHLLVQKTTLAAEEAWQHMIQGHKGPPIVVPARRG